MTTSAPAVPTTTTTPSPAARLLQLDAVLCAAVGLPLALAAGPVADLLGTARTGVVRVVGIALLLYALDLALTSRTRWAVPALRAAAVGNVAYAVVSLAVAALADLSTTGRVLIAAQGLAVGALAVVQLRAERR